MAAEAGATRRMSAAPRAVAPAAPAAVRKRRRVNVERGMGALLVIGSRPTTTFAWTAFSVASFGWPDTMTPSQKVPALKLVLVARQSPPLPSGVRGAGPDPFSGSPRTGQVPEQASAGVAPGLP